MEKKKHWDILLTSLLIVGFLIFYAGNDFLMQIENREPSQSVGDYADGSLTNGKRLPSQGANFQTYSRIASLAGRTCVHSTVRDIMLESYGTVAVKDPALRFKYGETGFAEGGKFSPHKSHQNGLSVDFFVPVRNRRNKITTVPTHLLNRFGYKLEFDKQGRRRGKSIDFEAMAVHLLVLSETARRHNAGIRVVIFDPQLQPYLFQTRYGQELTNRIRFSTQPSWVRHDEHYHVDFILK